MRIYIHTLSLIALLATPSLIEAQTDRIQAEGLTVEEMAASRITDRAELKQFMLDLHNYQEGHAVEIIADNDWELLIEKIAALEASLEGNSDADLSSKIAGKISALNDKQMSISRFIELYQADRDELLRGAIR